jgi:hypothetical protein
MPTVDIIQNYTTESYVTVTIIRDGPVHACHQPGIADSLGLGPTNGCASMISTILATLLAIHFDFNAVILLALACYFAATASFPGLTFD